MEHTVTPLCVNEFIGLKKYENMEAHPVQRIQENKILVEEELRMQSYSLAFGSHLPLKLTMERMITSQSRRLPGLRTSNLGLEVAMNRLQKIDYEDYLSTETPLASREDPRASSRRAPTRYLAPSDPSRVDRIPYSSSGAERCPAHSGPDSARPYTSPA